MRPHAYISRSKAAADDGQKRVTTGSATQRDLTIIAVSGLLPRKKDAMGRRWYVNARYARKGSYESVAALWSGWW